MFQQSTHTEKQFQYEYVWDKDPPVQQKNTRLHQTEKGYD